MGRVVGDDADAQAVEVLEVGWLRALGPGQDDDGEVQVRAGEEQVFLAFRGGHDAWQQVQVAVAGVLQHGAPAAGLDGRQFHAQALVDQVDVVGGQALVIALQVTEFEGGPGGIDAEAQFAMFVEPGLFFLGERQGPGRSGPECQPEHQYGPRSRHWRPLSLGRCLVEV
ncbi:hypothetical protein D3C85_775670 [compost metagenome]